MIEALEFFSGLGGLHYGLQGSGFEGKVISSYDINEHANSCYEQNFGLKPNQKSIEYLTKNDICKLKANCWLLSPPCQPYTYGGSKKDHLDGRAKGLLHLFEIFPSFERDEQPNFVFLENVPGFEVSVSRNHVVKTLLDCNFEVYEFIISPSQFGFPYERKRYFLGAHKRELFESRSSYAIDDVDQQKLITTPFWIKEPIQKFPLSMFLDDFENEQEEERHLVPNAYIETPVNFRFDIVRPSSPKCACFTKAYGTKHVFGSGPFLQTKNFEVEHDYIQSDVLLTLGLRFFTPNEIAKLHGFPVDPKINQHFGLSQDELFSFAPEITTIQKYRLLGNSLNCYVVSQLLNALFSGKLIEDV